MQELEADEAAADREEGFVDVVAAFVADAQSAVLMQPGDRALDDPALVAEPGTVTDLLRQRQRENELLFRVERAVLDFDHAALGGSLLKKWGLPQNITEPVKSHHNPGAAVKYTLEAAAVHAADVICNSMGISLASDWQVPHLGAEVWERLDIPLPQLENIVQQSELQMESTFAVLMEGS